MPIQLILKGMTHESKEHTYINENSVPDKLVWSYEIEAWLWYEHLAY